MPVQKHKKLHVINVKSPSSIVIYCVLLLLQSAVYSVSSKSIKQLIGLLNSSTFSNSVFDSNMFQQQILIGRELSAYAHCHGEAKCIRRLELSKTYRNMYNVEL